LQNKTYVIAGVIVIAVILVGTITGLYLYHPNQTSNLQPSKFQIVAGENFWGSLVSQLGGTHVQVTSVVTDPNADPHDYESSADNARAFHDAKYIIINGAGYDDWATRLIQGDTNPNQKILNVADLLGKHEGDNPHFWYGPGYVNQTVHQMYADLVSIDPADASYYQQQYSSLNASLGEYNRRINTIKQQYSGKNVASTESIFEYLAQAAGLNLITPPEFMKAVAEGHDPSPADKITFENQIKDKSDPGNATLLVYNEQTITPLTEEIKGIASQNHIPILPVTETIQPPDLSFQEWMNAEVALLQNQLNPNIG
jgi:zinc/manganese transport system substrate-binding protein